MDERTMGVVCRKTLPVKARKCRIPWRGGFLTHAVTNFSCGIRDGA